MKKINEILALFIPELFYPETDQYKHLIPIKDFLGSFLSGKKDEEFMDIIFSVYPAYFQVNLKKSIIDIFKKDI